MTQVHDSAWRNISCWVQNKSNSEIAGQLTIWVVYQLKLCLKTIFVCKIDGENASVRGRRESCVENKLAEEHKEILHYFWNKSFPDFGHFRIRKSDRKTVPSSSVIKVWQREPIHNTFETSGRANLEKRIDLRAVFLEMKPVKDSGSRSEGLLQPPHYLSAHPISHK